MRGEHPKQMQRLGMIAIERQCIAAEPLGVVELSGPVVLNRVGEQVPAERARCESLLPRTNGSGLVLLARRATVFSVHGLIRS
jgi:hypothetical protein